MDITNLKKEELLDLRNQIDLQLIHIDSVNKTILSDLDKKDEIFCISFNGSKIHHMDYVKISFHDILNGWINFSTVHDTKPM
jgi:hypothetical protein